MGASGSRLFDNCLEKAKLRLTRHVSTPEPLIAAEGWWGVVEYALDANCNHPAHCFLHSTLNDELGDKQAEKVLAKFLALFQQMADSGRVPNPSRFSSEGGDLHAFKYDISNNLIRIPCFNRGRSWVLTHGFFKPGAKKGRGTWPSEQIERAHRIWAEHLEHFAQR